MSAAYVSEREARERDALAALPFDDPLVEAERRRFVEALEALHHSARLLGLDSTEAYIPFAIRADAWLYRTGRLLERGRP